MWQEQAYGLNKSPSDFMLLLEEITPEFVCYIFCEAILCSNFLSKETKRPRHCAAQAIELSMNSCTEIGRLQDHDLERERSLLGFEFQMVNNLFGTMIGFSSENVSFSIFAFF